MKEKELSSADKCRRTKLRKKSVDELVEIILRKDDVERRLNKSVDTFKKLQVTNEKRIEILKDSLDKSEEHNKALYGRIDSLEKTIRVRNKEARILFATIVALIISVIILFFI